MNSALHIVLLGMGLAALPLWNHHCLIGTAFIWAALREQAQHRYILTRATAASREDHPGDLTLYAVDKRTFWDFGWLKWRQVWEIAQTTGGAVVVVLAYDFIVWEWLT